MGMRRRGLLAAFGVALFGCGGGSEHGFTSLYKTQVDPNWDEAPAIFSIRGSSPGDVWATGQFGLALHHKGNSWTKVPTSSSAGSLASLTGLSATSALVLDVVYGDMYRWNGNEWASVGGTSDYRFGIWAESPQSVWSVGGLEEHWDGTAWSPVQAYNSNYFGSVSANDLSSMYAAGTNGSVIHFDGAIWRDISPDTLTSLDGVWAEGTTGAWFVGAGGLILHWDGAAMNTVDGGTQHDLTAVTGTGPTDVWVAGNGGTVLHWDGSTWAYAATPNGEDINCAWAPQPNEVWIGDVSGTIWRYVP
jgi:hypothetical protein